MIEYTVRVYDDTGKIEWRHNGKLHREDGPAVYYTNSQTEYWYNNGLVHRDGGPAISYANGDKVWYQYDKVHREGGHAIEHANGTKVWMMGGMRHNPDGPAIVDGGGTNKRWFIKGREFSEEEFNDIVNPTVQELTVAEIEKLLGHKVKIVK